MIVKLLTEHYLEFLSLKGGCKGLSEPTHVKMPHCWKSHALAQFILFIVDDTAEIIWGPRPWIKASSDILMKLKIKPATHNL